MRSTFNTINPVTFLAVICCLCMACTPLSAQQCLTRQDINLPQLHRETFGFYSLYSVSQDPHYDIQPGMPLLPIITLQRSFAGTYAIHSVECQPLDTDERNEPCMILPAQDPLSNFNRIPSQQYQQDAWYPQQTCFFTTGRSRDSTHVFIQVYPLQYNPVLHKVRLSASIQLQIDGELISEPVTGTSAEHWILCPQQWQVQAQELADFHSARGVTTQVIPLSWIVENYSPAEEPTHPGVATTANPNLQNYEYETARRVIACLRDAELHPGLKKCTILGDGQWIPPSYYFYYDDGFGAFDSWLPSDMFYSSPDYDWVDNFQLTRVPLSTAEEMQCFVRKVTDWAEDTQSGAWRYNASVAGGDYLNNQYLVGEMMNAQVLNAGLLQGYEVDRLQLTNQQSSAAALAEHLQQDAFLWHFQASHGTVNTLEFDSGPPLDGDDVYQHPARRQLPIIISDGCVCGAFDIGVVTNPYTAHTRCLGESMLASAGGSIAYIGTARANAGYPEFVLENGNLRFLGMYDTYLLYYSFLDAYRRKPMSDFGGLASAARRAFLCQMPMHRPENCAAFTRFVVFADAALKLPAPPPWHTPSAVPQLHLTGASCDSITGYSMWQGSLDEPLYYSFSKQGNYSVSALTGTDFAPWYQYADVQRVFTGKAESNPRTVLHRCITDTQQEVWHFGTVSRSFKHLDGMIDDWSSAELRMQDAPEDCQPEAADLSALYLAHGNEQWWGFLPINQAGGSRLNFSKLHYAAAIDSHEGGFSTNLNAADDFAVPCWLSFGDAGINLVVSGTMGILDGVVNSKTTACHQFDAASGQWINQSASICWGEDGIEFVLPDSLISAGSRMVCFSSCQEVLPTACTGAVLDALPSENQRYETAQYGVESGFELQHFFSIEQDTFWPVQETAITCCCYPNPFTHATVFLVNQSQPGSICIDIYQINGQLCRRLKSTGADFSNGWCAVEWDGTTAANLQAASGIYLYRVSSGTASRYGKVTLIR